MKKKLKKSLIQKEKISNDTVVVRVIAKHSNFVLYEFFDYDNPEVFETSDKYIIAWRGRVNCTKRQATFDKNTFYVEKLK